MKNALADALTSNQSISTHHGRSVVSHGKTGVCTCLPTKRGLNYDPSTEGVTDFWEDQNIAFSRISNYHRYFGGDQTVFRDIVDKLSCDSMEVSKRNSTCIT